MSKHLERDLEQLQKDLLAQATLVEEAIYCAIRALQERSVELARAVIAGDHRIDLLENRVDEDSLRALALHQPVACDLRRITAAMMINTDLERMGDLAVDIAERALALADAAPVPIPARLQHMTELATAMTRQAIDAFVELDTDLAERVIGLDDEVDALNAAIITELVQLMQASPAHVEAALSLFSATRHLERIADHATNIAEDVVYLVQGEFVRHRQDVGHCD